MSVASSSPVPSSTSSSLITSNLLGSAREGGKVPVAGRWVMRRLGPWISPSRRARLFVRAATPPAWRPGLEQPPRCRLRRRGLWGPRGGRDALRRECSPRRRGHTGNGGEERRPWSRRGRPRTAPPPVPVRPCALSPRSPLLSFSVHRISSSSTSLYVFGLAEGGRGSRTRAVHLSAHDLHQILLRACLSSLQMRALFVCINAQAALRRTNLCVRGMEKQTCRFVFICHTCRVHRPSSSSGKKEKGLHQLQLGQSVDCISTRCCTKDHQVKNSSLEKYRALLKASYPSAKKITTFLQA